ncbi:hypothetical protein AAEX28_04435 [Lentisphaerota bacterium WC36G]|nr:hypothetical protein LJT99_07300 [Lentisphaerae bacterium WC36]
MKFFQFSFLSIIIITCACNTNISQKNNENLDLRASNKAIKTPAQISLIDIKPQLRPNENKQQLIKDITNTIDFSLKFIFKTQNVNQVYFIADEKHLLIDKYQLKGVIGYVAQDFCDDKIFPFDNGTAIKKSNITAEAEKCDFFDNLKIHFNYNDQKVYIPGTIVVNSMKDGWMKIVLGSK